MRFWYILTIITLLFVFVNAQNEISEFENPPVIFFKKKLIQFFSYSIFLISEKF